MELDNTWYCKYCGEVEPNIDLFEVAVVGAPLVCPDCGVHVEKAYICPGCGELVLEPDMMIDEFWLCKKCFKEELAAMMKENNNPRRIQIIDFLKECS